MIAVIVANGPNPDFHGFDDHLPAELISLGDRPFLQHVVENLIHQEIRLFHFLLSHLPQQTEAYFGNGARWGCSFDYHLVPPNRSPYELVEAIVKQSNQDVLIGRANYLPEIHLRKIHSENPGKAITFWRAGQARGRAKTWTGWALLPKRLSRYDFCSLTSDHSDSGGDGSSTRIVIPEALSAESGRQFLNSQKRILESQSSHRPMAGLQQKPGIWMSRSVSIDPTAELIAPLYVGAHCKVGAHAKIGPYAVIGNNCFVGAQTKIEDATVCPGTYIGEALELKAAIVDRSRLLNVDIGTSLSVSEAFLLSGLTEHGPAAPLRRFMDQAIAALLLLIFAPLLLLTWLFLGVSGLGRLEFQEFVQTPADEQSTHWTTRRIYRFNLAQPPLASRTKQFLLQFLPGLLSVLMGDLSLVGVRPRAAAEIRRLPHDLRSACLRTKSGLITETEIVFGVNPTEDEFYIGETYYGAAESLSYDLRLLGKFVMSFAKSQDDSFAKTPEPRLEDVLEESSRP